MQAPRPAGGDAYADFASIFDKFASAEEVTGTAKLEEAEEAAAAEDEPAPAEEQPEAAPKPVGCLLGPALACPQMSLTLRPAVHCNLLASLRQQSSSQRRPLSYQPL